MKGRHDTINNTVHASHLLSIVDVYGYVLDIHIDPDFIHHGRRKRISEIDIAWIYTGYLCGYGRSMDLMYIHWTFIRCYVLCGFNQNLRFVELAES
nr:unnamed protein product [Callosobruchus analis]